MIVRNANWKGTQLRGLGRLRGPEADLMALTSALAPKAAASADIVWTDCPDGSTVPADIGCPSYLQTISDYVGSHPGTVAVGAALLFAVMLFGGRGRR